MIDVALACEDAYSKLVEVASVADVVDENCVGISLLQILKLRFGHKAKLLFRLSDMNSTLGSVVPLAMFYCSS